MGTGYFLKRRQNTPILCYVKQRCLPNKLCFMTKPAKQGLDRVFLSREQSDQVLLSFPLVHSGSSKWALNTHLASFATTNTTNAADLSSKFKLKQRMTACWTRACGPVVKSYSNSESFLPLFCQLKCSTFPLFLPLVSLYLFSHDLFTQV